jgi:hypothetical protein
VKNYTFNFEVQTLLEQFVGAFNDIIVKRYDNNKTLTPPTSGYNVNFVYSPKQRVYDTLANPAPGGITVPVIAVNINSIQRDPSRVFNKIQGFDIEDNNLYSGYKKQILQPVPINIGVNMTIITKFQSDMDQIITNFTPYCDPYIIISWKLPFANNYEVRSEVLWNGQINLTYPNELAANQPYRVSADTGFTIKGWMFKKSDEVVKKIYTINEDFFTSDNISQESSILNYL